MTPRLSFLISFAEKYTLLLLNTGSTMVLARLLTPADTGVYAIGAVLTGVVQVLRDFGVGTYLIQEKTLSIEKLRAALGVSLLIGWLLALLLFAASDPAAQFYHEPRLLPVLQLLSFNLLLLPFSAVALACLRRQMRFKAIFAINVSQAVAQIVCSVVLAMLGWGFLSLALGTVAGTLATVIVAFGCRPDGLPCLPSWRGMRDVLSFGSFSTAGTLIDELGVSAPDLIIGKVAGMADVGIYGKATGVINVFNQMVTAAISPVIFPLFSTQVRAGGDLRAAYLSTASYITAMAWPFFAFVAFMAPELVSVLYGPQWMAAVPMIRVLCLSAGLYSVFNMARYLFVAMGEVKAQARLDAQAVVVRIAAVLVAAPYGLEAVAWAVVVGAVWRSALTYYYLRHLVGLRWNVLLGATWRSAATATGCMTGALAVQWHAPHLQGFSHLALTALAGGTCWLLAMWGLRHALAQEALALLHR